MSLAETFIAEMEHEAKATRAVLARVPDGKLDWAPHPKSMTLGTLAHHIATTPALAAMISAGDSLDLATIRMPPVPATAAAIVAELEECLKQAREAMRGLDDAAMFKPWSFINSGKTLMTLPKVAVLRSVFLNHWYHHRGQMSVYLRLLDIPVPSIYGPSADENPFG
jgi:uncharacterized damage-inducible protein DinB